MPLSELFVTRPGHEPGLVRTCASALLVSACLVLSFWLMLSGLNYRLDFSFLPLFHVRILDGLWLTIAVSVCALVVSTLIGLAVAAARVSRWVPLQVCAAGYVTLIRGTPLIMQIYLFFYLVGTALGVESRFAAGVIILSVFEGAYIAEIIRASYASLPAQQLLAARAIGLTRWQTIRLVVVPQMIARTLPALTGQFSSLIKDSSLLSMISVTELMQTMREISAINLKLIECYVFVGVLYLMLTVPLTVISQRLERKFSL